MSPFRIDTRLAATAVMALGLAVAAPRWVAAQAPQSTCQLWSQMEAAVKAGNVKAARDAEDAIALELDCNSVARDARKAVLDVYRAQDARLERAKAAPKDRLAQLEAALQFASNNLMAWDIHVKIAELRRKLPGKVDHAKISMGFDRALVAFGEMPESLKPSKEEIARISRLAYQHEALADTPLNRAGAYGRDARQINVGFVPAPIKFEFDKDELTDAGKAQAQIVLARLKERNMPQLDLVGHTDPVGSLAYNDDLSLRRAATIRKFLVDSGYPASRIKVAGRGKRDADTYYIEDRKSFTEAEIHQILRRVEMKFKD